MAAPPKMKHRKTVRPRDSTSGCKPKRMRSRAPRQSSTLMLMHSSHMEQQPTCPRRAGRGNTCDRRVQWSSSLQKEGSRDTRYSVAAP